MATVVALQSFVIRLKKDKTGAPPKDKQGNVIGQPPVTEKGESYQVTQGQMYEDNHPVVKAAPAMFGQVDSMHKVEQATAAPGQRRP